ncbi:MAG: GatB/YqeY domain-containing protein [Bauldia sp.]
MRNAIDVAFQAATSAQDRRRLNTLRLIKTTIKDRDIASREAGREGVSDEDVVCILGKMIKQRKEAAKLYAENGQADLAAEENAEIAIIEELLPRQLGEEEMMDVCQQAIRETGSRSLRDMGKCMQTLKERYAGQLDIGKAIQIVKARLQ